MLICMLCILEMLFSAQVEDLKAKLALQEVELWQKNADIEALIAKIGQQTDKLNQERAVADAEEQKVRPVAQKRHFNIGQNESLLLLMDLTLFQVAAIQTEVTKQQRETEEDLSKAEPALQAANAALNTLNRVIARLRPNITYYKQTCYQLQQCFHAGK